MSLHGESAPLKDYKETVLKVIRDTNTAKSLEMLGLILVILTVLWQDSTDVENMCSHTRPKVTVTLSRGDRAIIHAFKNYLPSTHCVSGSEHALQFTKHSLCVRQ